MENKPGEVLTQHMDQFDESGLRISSVHIEWYGLDNATANDCQLSIMERLTALVREWDQKKYKAAPGQDKRS